MQKLINYPLKETLRIDYFPLLRTVNDHTPANETNRRKENHLQEINNHLKSPAEIEAEFIVRAHEKTAHDISGNATAKNPLRQELVTEELTVTIETFSMNLPDYMEENY
ncbi:MAG: hypothetical protein ABUT20_15045 [Bacteroidota bacterium]